ncbi:hypothetical protein C8R45DRAFT_1115952 [Mycena sanguinolenta]|nr:hypothetical protein C8R45DRAFT_1115952 [Mycena sanguinolenta]
MTTTDSGAPGSPTLPLDVIHKILTEDLDLGALEPSDIQSLAQDATTFFHTVTRPNNIYLARSVRTLQTSFDTDPKLYHQHDWETFWWHFRACLGATRALKTLICGYSQSDFDFLSRLVSKGDLEHCLASSTQTLHLKPVFGEIFFQEDHNEDLTENDGPWDSNEWRLHISRIPHVHTLIVSAPFYIIWPPTRDQHDRTLSEWTAQLRRQLPHQRSCLMSIILNYGYGDEADMVEKWEDEQLLAMDDLFEPREVCGGPRGVQIVWRKGDGLTWESHEIDAPSSSNREEYFFGGSSCFSSHSWLHVDEVTEAQEWREDHIERHRSQRRVRYEQYPHVMPY